MKDNICCKKQQEEAIHLQSRIDLFFDNFCIGTLLNKAGIRKLRGASPAMLLKAIFMLTFEGASFFQRFVVGDNQVLMAIKKCTSFGKIKVYHSKEM
jgi:hypothetical protein